MGLLAPLFLLAGLAVALPLWLHRLNVQSAERRPFSSAMLLEAARQQVHVRKQLRYRLLLALRAAVLLLVALAFAKPVWTDATPDAVPPAATHLLVIDGSLSMGRDGLAAQTRRQAAAVLEALPDGVLVQVIGADARIRALSEPSVDRTDHRRAIDTWEPTPLRLDYGVAMAAVDRLAALTFWAGLPWVLKMPMGHLVDLFWRYKSLLVLIGASLIAASLLIMYGLIAHTDAMRAVMPVASWYVIAILLAPSGYVVQDVVADAMTVEAVPTVDPDGVEFPKETSRAMHTTMQTLGRFSIITGLAVVAAVNIYIFSGTEALPQEAKAALYARVYLIALMIPVISVSGILLHALMQGHQARRLAAQGVPPERIAKILNPEAQETEADWQILGGGLAFVVLSTAIGLSEVEFAQEIVFAGSMTVIVYLISRLLKALEPEQAMALVGTAVIIFIFRAVPLPGPGLTWFEIDELGFDERFLAILSLLTSVLTLVGLVVLRPLMAKRSIAYIVVLLTLAAGVLSLPNIGLYYGVHEWTAARTAGVVDARFIAILDTAIESPLGQVAMVPMLAWIARNAPAHLKATFFAVMASFTNLALSASSLGTKYLNEYFLVTREVIDRETGRIVTAADYSELGYLLVTVAIIGLAAPLLAVAVIQLSPLRTSD